MTPEYANQVTAGLLILWFSAVLAIGILLSLVAVGYARRAQRARQPASSGRGRAGEKPALAIFEQHCQWLAIHNRRVGAVQSALALHNPQPCAWAEGVSRCAEKLYISPPARGWILVLGHGLPELFEDAEACFHLVTRLSRSLGAVQLFGVHRALNYHGWVRAEHGRVVRAYVWAGETLWNQGRMSAAEIELGIKCFAYCVEPGALSNSAEALQRNSDKLFLLASRWSIDPSMVDESMLSESLGVSGNLAQRRPK